MHEDGEHSSSSEAGPPESEVKGTVPLLWQQAVDTRLAHTESPVKGLRRVPCCTGPTALWPCAGKGH